LTNAVDVDRKMKKKLARDERGVEEGPSRNESQSCGSVQGGKKKKEEEGRTEATFERKKSNVIARKSFRVDMRSVTS
jgi:hypothetical protein